MLPCSSLTSHFREHSFPELEDLMAILIMVILWLVNSFHQKTIFSCLFAWYFWDKTHFPLARGKPENNWDWIFLEYNPNKVFLVQKHWDFRQSQYRDSRKFSHQGRQFWEKKKMWRWQEHMVGGGRAASLLCETQACWEQDLRQWCGFLINTFPVSQHSPN